MEGEKLVMEIEAELWARSPNPIMRLIGAIKKIISMILGFRIKGFLIITDRRVIEVRRQIRWYCITTGKIVKYVLPSSVKEIGYTKAATCGCLCPRYVLYYLSLTDGVDIRLKSGRESDALNAANAFYESLFAAKA